MSKASPTAPPRERNQATRLHRDPHRGDDSGARLRIESGFVRVGSLGLPGYGAPPSRICRP